MPVHDLLLIRHGATTLNERGAYQGWGGEGLSDLGREQVTGLRESLSISGALPPATQLWSSDLPRCRETAKILFGDAPIRFDERLRELDFGPFAGRTYRENLEAEPETFRAWIEDPWTPPEGVEPLGAFQERVRDWFEDLNPARGTAVVFHGGAIGVVLEALAEADPTIPGPGEAIWVREKTAPLLFRAE